MLILNKSDLELSVLGLTFAPKEAKKVDEKIGAELLEFSSALKEVVPIKKVVKKAKK